MRNSSMPKLPTHEEAEKIIPIIKAAFAAANVEIKTIGESPKGGVLADAVLLADKKDALVRELFSQGIVMIELPSGGLGFAIRR